MTCIHLNIVLIRLSCVFTKYKINILFKPAVVVDCVVVVGGMPLQTATKFISG